MRRITLGSGDGNGGKKDPKQEQKKPEQEAKPAETAPTVGKADKLPISPNLDQSQATMKAQFKDCSDVMFRKITIAEGHSGLIVFIDGITNTELISEHTIRPLVQFNPLEESDPNNLHIDTIVASQLSEFTDYTAGVDAVLTGNAVLFIEGYSKGLIINAIGGTRRGVEEPSTEAVIRGPREGFTERLRVNTGLLRFKIKSPDLKMVPFTLGKQTKTSVALCYMEGLIEPTVLEEVTNRLKRIEIDGVLESGYIEELIEDNPYSPFPQMQYSERPDTVASLLLEGRFAIMVDGTPFVITGPVTSWQFLQASEDYYERFYIGNLLRWLRFLFLFIALFLPGLYVSVTTFHQDMLPTNLLLSIAAARESIPFPVLVEALMMEVAFEALREAGIRLPKTVGQAVSILGALVIGQAAVEAGIVSAPIVMIVALTGIASFTIPRFNMAISLRLLRFPLMVMGGIFGLFGIVVGTVWIAAHMCGLRSFGVPYLGGIAPYRKKSIKDILIRAPWWAMLTRPGGFSSLNRQRMAKGLKPSPKKQGGR